MNILIVDYPQIFIILIAFLVNLPLGYFRQGAKKFSVSWYLWIHASIPLIIYLRVTLGVSAWLIPLMIAAAVLGQLAGSYIRQRRLQNA